MAALCLLCANPALAAVERTFAAQAGVEFSETVGSVQASQCTQNSHETSGTIEWGDGGSSAAELSNAPALGTYLVSGRHTYLKPGTYTGTFTGTYHCQAVPVQFTAIHFTVEVTGSETPVKTSTTTAPPPPPVAKAAFTVASVAPGRAVLDASASTPAGSAATSYSWNVSGGAAPDAVCQGDEPELTITSPGALTGTVSLTAVDSASGASTVATLPLSIPAPLRGAHTSRAARATAFDAGARTASVTRQLSAAVTPAFKVIGTCAGAGVPIPLNSSYKAALAIGSSLTPSIGGAPPASCLENTQFGAADIEGCLGEVAEIGEIPGGLTLGLSKLLCGAKLESFCIPALSGEVDHVVSSLGSAIGARAARVGDDGLSAHEALQVPAARGLIETALGRSPLPIYFSTDPVRLNGLDIDPQSGFPIVIIPSADMVVALDARVYFHGVPLTVVPALVLHLPDVGGHLGELKLPKSVPVIGTLPFEGSISIDLHRAGSRLPNGDTCTYDCAAVSVHLGLPGVFTNGAGEGLSAGAVLTADDQQGLELDSFELSIPEADLGGIGISDVNFRYLRGNDSLHGGATLDLGPIGDIGATIDFVHGHFNGAHLEYTAGVGPGIDLGGPIPIFLTELGGGVTLEPPVIEATGAIAGGPNVLGCSLFGIEAQVVLEFEPEFSLNANGTGQFLCQSVASEYFHLDGAGHIGLGATVHLHFLVFSVEGGFNFDVDTAQGHFQADGNVNACLELFGEHCLGAEAVVSDRGIGVCADLGFTHAGGGIQFPSHAIVFLDTCDIGKFRSLGFTTGLHGSTAAAQSFRVPRGEHVAVIGLPGSGAAPRATLRGPSGRTISTPASGYEKTATDVVISDEKVSKETYFFIDHPEAGAWTITPEAGSAPITSIQQAASLPSPAVRARVTRAGAGRDRLSYSLRAIPGQHVVFAERQSGGNFREIGSARGRRGSLEFTPSAQLAAKRTIEALVSQDGRPREDDTVAHFTVSRRETLPAPRRLRLHRHGSTLAIGFAGVRGAAGYALTVHLGDGRSLLLRLGPKARNAMVASVAANVSADVRVAALLPGTRLREGRRSVARLKAGPQPLTTVVRPLRT